MQPPRALRHVTDDERAVLPAGLRRQEAFTVRRGQMWFASAARQPPSGLATPWRGAPPTVRHVLQACHAQGLGCVPRRSTVPRRVEPVRTAEPQEP